MPTLYRQGNWKITMYFRDHPPPHFHVVTSSREEAQVAIRDLELIADAFRHAFLERRAPGQRPIVQS